MKFNAINFNHKELTFNENMTQMEIFGVERVASEVLNLDIEGFSYDFTTGSLDYHAEENEKINGLNIGYFKLSGESLYLFLEDDNENTTVLRLEFA